MCFDEPKVVPSPGCDHGHDEESRNGRDIRSIYWKPMFVPRKGLTTPLTRWVARCCYLCAGAVYVLLLGSPTSLVTSVSYLRKIHNADVLHHPFLFGEIPM